MKNRAGIITLILTSFLVFYFTLKDDFISVFKGIIEVKISFVFVALLLLFVSWVFRAKSMHEFFKEIKKDYKLKDALNLNIIAQFLNGITPFSSGGQPFQMYLLKKQDIKINESANALIKDFFCYQFSLVLISLIAIIYNYLFKVVDTSAFINKLILIGFLVNIFVIIIILSASYAKNIGGKVIKMIINKFFLLKALKNKEDKKEKYIEGVDKFYQGAISFKKNKLLLFKSIFYNVLSLTALYMIPFFVFQSLNITTSLNVVENIICISLIMLIGAFVPIPGGTGGLEYCFILFFGNFISGPILGSAMLIWRFITYYFGMMVGSFALALHKERG